jgi:hypothetical protein
MLRPRAPNDTYYAEIRTGDERIGLGTYEIAHKIAPAYDTVAWPIGSPRSSMIFNNVWTRHHAEDLASPRYTVTRDECAACPRGPLP